MSLIQLNIRYDPDYPFDCAEEPIYDASEPRFPYRRGGVSVLGLYFKYERRNTGGPDPYAGDEWSLRLSTDRIPWLSLRLSNLVCDEAVLRMGSREWRVCEYSFGAMPSWFRGLWGFLEYRKEWWERHQPECYHDDHYWE